jgi:hypothetical protein
VQTKALYAMQLATEKEALVVSVTSRLWLTVLEVLPGLIYLARSTRLLPKRDGSNS